MHRFELPSQEVGTLIPVNRIAQKCIVRISSTDMVRKRLEMNVFSAIHTLFAVKCRRSQICLLAGPCLGVFLMDAEGKASTISEEAMNYLPILNIEVMISSPLLTSPLTFFTNWVRF